MSLPVKDLMQRAAAVCATYIEESLLTCADEYVATWVPLTYRAKMACYILQWYRAMPLKGIILGQSPSSLDSPNTSFPDTGPIPLSAAFSYNEDALACKRQGVVVPPLATDLLAQEIGKTCAVDEEAVLTSLRDCHTLLDQGVIVWYALPLGKQEIRYNNYSEDAFRLKHNSRQIQTLAHALHQLISISNEMEPSALESTTVVALGVWARRVSAAIRTTVSAQSAELTRRLDIKDEAVAPGPCLSQGRGRTREGFLPIAPPAELRAIHALLNFPRQHCSPSSMSPVPERRSPTSVRFVDKHLRDMLRMDDAVSCSSADAAGKQGKPRLRLELDISRAEDDDPRHEVLVAETPAAFGAFTRARYTVKEKGKAIMIEEPEAYASSTSDSDDD